MRVYNVHERQIDVPADRVGALLDGLSGPTDRLWPGDRWPAMEFDAPLGKGAKGGHGPVKYSVSEYEPGCRVVFAFDDSGIAAGFQGTHCFEVLPSGDSTVLRHVIDAECPFGQWLRWVVAIRPLHDALLEDALDRAQREFNVGPDKPAQWSAWVRFLRRMIGAGR